MAGLLASHPPTVTLTPASRVSDPPRSAVACTTWPVLGAYDGGVTVNVATGAWPGRTTPSAAEDGRAVQPCGTCSVIRGLSSVWSPAAVSVTVTGNGLPAVTVDGALTETCRAPGVDVPVTPPRSGRPASAEESPTSTW